ncbi:unnamed protein product [Calypogeia fissa]
MWTINRPKLQPMAVEKSANPDPDLAQDVEIEELLSYTKPGTQVHEQNSYSKINLTTGSERTKRWLFHLLTSLAIAVYLGSNCYYLLFKGKLYASHFRDVLSVPWLLLVWLLEIIYFGGSIISAVENLLPPSNRADLQFDGLSYPMVDILLPCCKEPTDVPEDSIRAALKLEYPSDRFRVLVLDDGGDDELKAICETMQVETGGRVLYLRRRKVAGVPHNFKCGNLNYGLKHSEAEYVVMMDADMILHPTFLRKLLPHIVNSQDISFVQIPQSFYNLPVGDPLNDSCILGYDKMLVHRDSLGCATCVGTGAIFRREHLNAIGGFQPHSITEDTTTAYALFKEGYRSVYLNEKLQIGLSPWTFEGYIKQRCRWGQGAMQQFKSTWKQMLIRKESKLNLVLKTLYFWHSGYYFLSIVNVLLVATLLSVLIFQLRLTVGSEEENRQLIINLAWTMIFWRIFSILSWLEVPQSVQSRNRDESHFWWMTPFYVKMLMESFFSYNSTFQFVPTSNIDRKVAKTENEESSPWMKDLSQLKQVKFHLGYTITIVTIVIPKLYIAYEYYGLENCRERFYVYGISFFLLSTCAHMMLPVTYIIWPTNFEPSDRKALLRHDSQGVPVFNPEEFCHPKWHWSVLFYEALAYLTLAYWMSVVWLVKSGAEKSWCKVLSY